MQNQNVSNSSDLALLLVGKQAKERLLTQAPRREVVDALVELVSSRSDAVEVAQDLHARLRDLTLYRQNYPASSSPWNCGQQQDEDAAAAAQLAGSGALSAAEQEAAVLASSPIELSPELVRLREEAEMSPRQRAQREVDQLLHGSAEQQPSSPSLARAFRLLAEECANECDDQHCLRANESAVAIYDRNLAESYSALTHSLEEMADASTRLGDRAAGAPNMQQEHWKRALASLQRAIAISEKHLGGGGSSDANGGSCHPETLALVVKLACVYGRIGDHRRKRQLIQDVCLPAARRIYGPRHAETANVLMLLGEAHVSLNQFFPATAIFEDVIVMKEVLAMQFQFQREQQTQQRQHEQQPQHARASINEEDLTMFDCCVNLSLCYAHIARVDVTSFHKFVDKQREVLQRAEHIAAACGRDDLRQVVAPYLEELGRTDLIEPPVISHAPRVVEDGEE